MQRPSISYVVLGAGTIAWRGTRRVAPLGVRAARASLWPAATVYASPPARRVRARAAESSYSLAGAGYVVVDRAGDRLRQRGTEAARQLETLIVDRRLGAELAEVLMTTGALPEFARAVIHHPTTEGLLDDALEDPAVDRLVTRVLDSEFTDRLTARLIASEEMQVILEYVTRSPELRAALSRQTAGLAGDVASGVRVRTASADETTERIAQQLFRRLRSTGSPSS